MAYVFSHNWLNKVTKGTIQNASIYASANDLFTITNYTGTDVAGNTLSAAAGGTGGEGYDCWSLPTPRSYSVGLSVTFGSNDEAPKPVYQNTTALNEEINTLRARLLDAEKQNNDLQNGMTNQQNVINQLKLERERLERELSDCKNKGPKIVDNSKQFMNILVHFPVNKTAVGADQRPNVERIAAYMKSHPEATCEIKGYASPEGPQDVNIKLANGRAASVKDMLVNKYGIAANRIKAEGQGISNMFDELSWNRVSICEIIVK